MDTGNNDYACTNPCVFANGNIFIILQTFRPELRSNRMIGGCNGHIRAKHYFVTNINVPIINTG